MVCFDGALYVFQFMQADKLVANINRYGDYIPEILPYLAYKMDFPFHTIVLLYSVSFIILHYIIFLIVTLILKNNGAGIAIMLASCLSYYHAFYMPMMQLNESIIAAILLWAFIHPETPFYSVKERNLYALGALATIVYMSFLHPIGLIAIVFIIGMEMIGAKRFKDPVLWLLLILSIVWFILKLWVFFRNQYDMDRIVPLSVIIKQLPNWKQWPSTHYLDNLTWLHFRTLKWLILICVLLCLRKGVLFFLFVTLTIIGFTLFYLAMLYKGESEINYECYYCFYGFLAGLLFVFIFYHPRRKNLVMFLALPLLYLGIHRIYSAHDLLSARVAYLNRLIERAEKTKERKGIVDEKCYPYLYAMAPWNVAFETLVYSAIRGADSTVTVFIRKPDMASLADSVQNKRNAFLGAHFAPTWYTSNDMPEEYFKLPSTGYICFTHYQDDTSFHESNFSASNLKIRPLVQEVFAKGNDWQTVIAVEITNTSGKRIPAIPGKKNTVYLTCRLYDAKGKLVRKGIPQAIEADIDAQSVQGILLYYPMDKGIYYAEPDFISGKGSWNIPTQRIAINVK
jgi:hypothetical protein